MENHANLDSSEPQNDETVHQRSSSHMSSEEHELSKSVAKLIAAQQWRSAAEKIVDIASETRFSLALGEMSSLERIAACSASLDKLTPRAFRFLRPSEQAIIISKLSIEGMKAVWSRLTEGQRASVLQLLPPSAIEPITPLLSEDELRDLDFNSQYKNETVGRFMFGLMHSVTVPHTFTVAQLFKVLKRKRESGKDASTIFVVDSTEPASYDQEVRLLGIVSLQRAMAAKNPTETPLTDIMSRDFFYVEADTKTSDFLALYRTQPAIRVVPVLSGDDSSQMRFAGILTPHNIVRMLEHDHGSSLQKSLAIQPFERSYSKTSFLQLVLKRIPWLAVLVILAGLASSIIGAFEELLESVIALALFIPMLIGAGGNIGSQSATLIISALSSKDIKRRDWYRVLLREAFVGGAISLILAAMGWFIAFWRSNWQINVGWTVGLAMLTLCLFSNVAGAMLPFVASLIHIDPAAASSPVITTIIDLLGIAIYFGWAAAFFNFQSHSAAPATPANSSYPNDTAPVELIQPFEATPSGQLSGASLLD